MLYLLVEAQAAAAAREQGTRTEQLPQAKSPAAGLTIDSAISSRGRRNCGVPRFRSDS